MREKRVIISGGGTGGHLFPALVLGRKLGQMDSELELTFVGSGREAERTIMARHKVRFVPMRIEGLKGRGWRRLKALGLLPGAFLRSLALLIRTNPALVVGVGGYSSGPIVLLASWLGIPTLILEQNVRPGFTNRLLLRWVRKAVAAFEASLPYFKGKGVCLGNPVREEFYSVPPKQRDGRLTLLVFGGSQGSHFLNLAVVETLPLLGPVKDRLRIYHQTGERDLDWVKRSYADQGFAGAVTAPFFIEMPDLFAKTDLVLGRAGATTCAELIAARKASILVPFARAADDHQAGNAAALKDAGGADVILESEWTPARLAEKILAFLEDPERISVMEKNLDPLKKEAAAEAIAGLCFELMEARR
ncbi:MAG: undecaprenyldiphospho-muramoylpentapeptide beta-N-acetylglucosaminyltransferase [Candidatus Aminicenantes bacterium]|nr:undecaprenyldiphospho-muramoylpentapeptide beta-N-acetylglucosaminyltransferase [Candidatus Aminicenantes bacterium]